MATLYPALARAMAPHPKMGADPGGGWPPGSRRRVCGSVPKGHTWQAAVFSRSQGADCPVCTGRTVLPGKTTWPQRFPSLAGNGDQERTGP